jgi:hypothetical protein
VSTHLGQANLLYAQGKYLEAVDILMKVIQVRVVLGCQFETVQMFQVVPSGHVKMMPAKAINWEGADLLTC